MPTSYLNLTNEHVLESNYSVGGYVSAIMNLVNCTCALRKHAINIISPSVLISPPLTMTIPTNYGFPSTDSKLIA